MRHRNLFHSFTGLLLSIGCGSAAAWTWSLPISSPTPSPLYPSVTAVDTAGNLWVAGQAQTGNVVARYDGFGAASYTSVTTAYSDYPVRQFAAGNDGSMLAASSETCDVVKYDANGTYRWKRSEFSGCPRLRPRDLLFSPADADGEHWLALSRGAVRFGTDGRELARITAPHTDWQAQAADVRDGRLFATSIESASAAVTAYDRRGTRLWQWRGPAGATNDSLSAAVAADGSLRVVGIAGGGLFVAMIATDGASRWIKAPATGTPPAARAHVYAPLVDSAGNTWVVFEPDDTSAGAVLRVDATGEIVLSRGFAQLGQPVQAASLGQARIAPDGDLLLARRGTLSRIAGDGTVRYTRALEPDDGPYEPMQTLGAFDPAGAAVVVTTGYDDGGIPTMTRIARDGSDVAPPAAQVRVDPPMSLVRTLLPDGSLLAWTGTPLGDRELLRIDGSGRVAWRTATPGAWLPAIQGAITTNGDRVCVVDAVGNGVDSADYRIACHRATDGSPLWSQMLQPIDLRIVIPAAQGHVDANGSVSVWYGASPGGIASVGFSRLDRDGAVQVAKNLGSGVLNYGRLTFNGRFALVRAIGFNGHTVFDDTGTERYRPTLPSGASGNEIAFDAEGGMVVANYATTVGQVLRVDSRGTTLWTRELRPSRSAERPPAIGADAVYVLLCCSGTAPDAGYLVTRLALSDGREVWRHPTPTPTFAVSMPYLAVTPAGDAVAVVESTLSKIRIDVFDTADGRLRAQHREACAGDLCVAPVPLIDATSKLHIHDLGLQATASAIAAWQIPPRDARAIRLDQPGIAGAWWSPYANGEGFVLDYLPDSRTLFMPWFTFSRYGGNDPAEQRWYVVQGAVPANATSVELPITESTGGAFDAGPTVAPTIVGTATLSFTDCDNGTLRYRFNADRNGGAAGTITLTRLSPATQNCQLADGSTQTRSSTPSNGFDARMSGSWFEPATSGQGLQLTVQPGGIFFAPWFTYDPADASDDPGKQHWFTIQGSLANARNGVAELPIVQTIGGAFDSVPTSNMYIVGKATLTMLACDRARLDYRFDDNELAAPLRARTGSIDLTKAGGCAP